MAAWSAFWAHHPPHSAYVLGAYAASAIGGVAIVSDTLVRAWKWKSRASERNEPL